MESKFESADEALTWIASLPHVVVIFLANLVWTIIDHQPTTDHSETRIDQLRKNLEYDWTKQLEIKENEYKSLQDKNEEQESMIKRLEERFKNLENEFQKECDKSAERARSNAEKEFKNEIESKDREIEAKKKEIVSVKQELKTREEQQNKEIKYLKEINEKLNEERNGFEETALKKQEEKYVLVEKNKNLEIENMREKLSQTQLELEKKTKEEGEAIKILKEEKSKLEDKIKSDEMETNKKIEDAVQNERANGEAKFNNQIRAKEIASDETNQKLKGVEQEL
jgi:hypothetical protein